MQDKEDEETGLSAFEDALAAALGLVVPPHEPAQRERGFVPREPGAAGEGAPE